jgi:hypothetical protein
MFNSIANLPWVEIAAIIAAVYTVASIVVRLTPTPKDDEVLDKVAPVKDKILWIIDRFFTASNRK